MLSRNDFLREEQELLRNKLVILHNTVVWTDMGAKTLNDDGSFKDGTNSQKTIIANITPFRESKKSRIPQGLEEMSTHVMYTLKAWDITEDDVITYLSKEFVIVYKFPNQFDLEFSEYLLKVYN